MDVYASERAFPQEDFAVPPPAIANPMHFHLRRSVYAPLQGGDSIGNFLLKFRLGKRIENPF